MLALPQGAAETAPMDSSPPRFTTDGRAETHQVRGDANGSHAGSAAAMRDAEGLVEVEVADVRAHVAGPAEADLGVHVCAVHVDLAAMRMDDLADFLDGFFKDAVGGGISDHQCR